VLSSKNMRNKELLSQKVGIRRQKKAVRLGVRIVGTPCQRSLGSERQLLSQQESKN